MYFDFWLKIFEFSPIYSSELFLKLKIFSNFCYKYILLFISFQASQGGAAAGAKKTEKKAEKKAEEKKPAAPKKEKPKEVEEEEDDVSFKINFYIV